MKMTAEQYQDHCNEYDGYCVVCDDITNYGGVEPDARGYPCDECHGKRVMGVEEAMAMGKVIIVAAEGDEDE